jgi:hypothetical protein
MPLHLTLRRPLAVVFLFVGFICQAQEAENVSFANTTDQKGFQSIQFSYDLAAEHPNIPCFVRVKFTMGTRQFYLKQVTGDVGNMVYPGKRKVIIWDYKEELIHNTSTETVTINVEVFPNLSADTKVKRGKNIVVNLDDIYEKGKNYSVKLYRREKEVGTLIDSLSLQHHFVTQIPRKSKVGKDYQIAIVGGEKPLFTNSFKIKPRVGTFWKVLPFIAVPVYILTKQQLEEFKDLPGAPAAPAN